MDLERIPGYMADYLSANGVAAEPAWSGRERTALAGPKAVVSVRKCQVGPAGFQDYLGEQFDKDSGQWRELYGRKAELTLGLDLVTGLKALLHHRARDRRGDGVVVQSILGALQAQTGVL